MFGAILGLWVIPPEGPSALGIIRSGLTLQEWVLDRTVIGWKLPQSKAIESHYYVNLVA